MTQLIAIGILIIYAAMFFYCRRKFNDLDVIGIIGMAFMGSVVVIIVVGSIMLLLLTAIGVMK